MLNSPNGSGPLEISQSKVNCNVNYIRSDTAEKLAVLAKKNRMQIHDLQVRRLKDVVLAPLGGYAGLYEDGKAIPHSHFSRAATFRESLPSNSLKGAGELHETVFFLGKFHVCWGHCITDGLKFLWPFLNLEKYPFLKNCKIVYTTLSRDDVLPKNYLEILRLLGIEKDRLVRLDWATVLHDCYLADESFGVDGVERWFTPEYRFTIERIVKACGVRDRTEKNGQKIYLSRSRWHGWTSGEFGERYVEKAFRDSGYDIVHPEQMHFGDFVQKMYSAAEVAATECSCSHNALFMSAGARLVLLRKFDQINNHQLVINQFSDLDVVYVDIGKSILFVNPKMHTAGPFFMYVTKYLARYLGVKASFPIGEFAKYLNFACYQKGYRLLYDIAYGLYKLIVVRWLGITKWNRGQIVQCV